MGGIEMQGRRVILEEGVQLAAEFGAKLLEIGTKKVEVAGSIRRKKPEIGDIDLVVIGDEDAMNTSLGEFWGWQKPKLKADPLKAKKVGLWRGVQVDVLITDEDSLGAAMMYYTGSKETNIKQRVFALKREWLLNERGLWHRQSGEKLAGKTEREVYERMEIEWLEPEQR